jgi:molecular chaperone HscB
VPINAERNTAMPTAFLMQQMQWREALEDAASAAAVATLDEQVAHDEGAMMDTLTALLDEHNNTTAAAAQVRALMFVARFRQDIERRLDTLDANR